VRRQASRLRLILEQRQLARLETALGLLGWQQADYDAATQEHVSRLTDCEREQSRLTNESAALGLEIQQIEERRGGAQREFSEAQAVALEREQPTVADETALAALVVAGRRECKEIEARLPVLDRELRAVEERYRTTVVHETPTPQVRAQLLQWRKVILALPRERAEWTAKLAEATGQLSALETLLAALRGARARFEKCDEELTGEIATRQRAKRKMEKQIDAVEKAKTDPYREIGRALADYDIGPLNQPDVLVAVHAQRQKIAMREAKIAASLAESARDRGGAAGQSRLLAGGMIGFEAAAFLAIVVQ